MLNVVNGSLIAAGARIPTFGVLGGVSNYFLALYGGTAAVFIVFLIWVNVRFAMVCCQDAEDEDPKAVQRLPSGTPPVKKKGRRVQTASEERLALKRQEPQYSYLNPQDVDEVAAASLERIVARLQRADSAAPVEIEMTDGHSRSEPPPGQEGTFSRRSLPPEGYASAAGSPAQHEPSRLKKVSFDDI
jgi:hypothetical protein